jgi:hypothetical protein
VALMGRDRDKLLGASPGGRAARSPPWTIVVAAVAVLLAVALAFVLGRTTAVQPREQQLELRPQSDQPPVAEQSASQQASTQSSDDQRRAEIGDAGAAPRALSADFLITDSLLANPPTYEDFEGEPMRTSVCLGDPLRIANVSSRRVGLIDTPAESDASAQLGFVDPGAVFILEPQEVGTFFISAAGIDGLLFRYVAERCRQGRPQGAG